MIRVICLAENTAAAPTFGAEHGLSLYIETASRRILFDMGQSGLFADNAALLGVSLSAIDTAIVSHGHYDHSGGLRTFLSHNDTAPIYISRHAFEPHYNGEKYIGVDTALQTNERLRVTDGTHPLGDGLTLFANALSVGTLASGSAGLSVERDGERIPDDFRHEQYLLIEDDGKRILISGCSHRGIVDIVTHFTPDILIGGFHLSKHDPADVADRYAPVLNSCPTTYYTCHCTGVDQYHALRSVMPRLHYLAGGQELTL